MARVEGARVAHVASVHGIGTHVRAPRRRGVEHARLRVARLAHVDDFKIVEVRAPLVVAATAETVEKSVFGGVKTGQATEFAPSKTAHR
eukprot:scaffold50058_cov60-Phaeocystis_antarctica.AAC.3